MFIAATAAIGRLGSYLPPAASAPPSSGYTGALLDNPFDLTILSGNGMTSDGVVPVVNADGGSFSMGLWVKIPPTLNATKRRVLGQSPFSVQETAVYIDRDGVDLHLNTYQNLSTNVNFTVRHNRTFVDDEWIHLIVAFTSLGTAKMFLDGVLVAETGTVPFVQVMTLPVFNINFTEIKTIGVGFGYNNLAWWSYPIDAAEAILLYNNGCMPHLQDAQLASSSHLEMWWLFGGNDGVAIGQPADFFDYTGQAGGYQYRMRDMVADTQDMRSSDSIALINDARGTDQPTCLP